MAAAIRSNLLMDSKCAIAAEMLGLPIENVRVELGDSDFPQTPGSGGSWGAASAGSALYDACTNLRAQLAQKLGANLSDVSFAEGRISANGRSESIGSLAGTLGLQAEGQIKKGDMAKKFSQQGYGAHFAEVAVDMDTGEIRLRRMLGVFAAGRILNLKTATSQATGAMIWGVGELGICGAGAAVANAVYNATGVRIHEFPLTLDKVMAGRERQA